MSMKCITLPPSMFPSAFASFGSTNSVNSDREALTGFPATAGAFSRFAFCF
jgi:hypothetical protein